MRKSSLCTFGYNNNDIQQSYWLNCVNYIADEDSQGLECSLIRIDCLIERFLCDTLYQWPERCPRGPDPLRVWNLYAKLFWTLPKNKNVWEKNSDLHLPLWKSSGYAPASEKCKRGKNPILWPTSFMIGSFDYAKNIQFQFPRENPKHITNQDVLPFTIK